MTEATHEQASRKRSISDGIDKWLFLAFLLAGAAAIVGMKQLGFDQLHVTSVPVVLLLAYAFIAFLVPRFRLRADRVADNCYYMGFLFTLASLGYALYQFETGSEGTSKIVENFGIALASTIVGLALRVFINQFREDPIEIEREARLELAEAASRLRAELDTMVREFKLSAVAMRQGAEESVQTNAKDASESLALIAKQFQEVTGTVIGQLKESFEAHSKTSRRLNKVTDHTVSTFEAVIERIERIEAPSDLLTARLQPAIDEIERAARSVRDRQEGDAERLTAIEGLVDQSVRAAEGLDKRLLGLGRHLGELDGLAERVAKLRVALDGAMAPFADVMSAHQKAIETLRSAADARAKDAGESFQRIMENQANALSDFVSRLEAARSAVLTPLSEITEERSRDLARFSEAFAASLHSIEQHNRSLEAELTKSREATIKVQSQLSEAAELIVKELGVDARGNGELPEHSPGPA